MTEVVTRWSFEDGSRATTRESGRPDRYPLGMRLLTSLALLLLLLPCLGCESVLPEIEEAEDAPFSPIPPRIAMGPGGYSAPPRPAELDQDNSTSLDELLAIVEGKYLNRRQLHRRLALPDQFVPEKGREAESLREYEDEIERETLKWAQERIFIKAAERAGIKLPPSRLDEMAEKQLEKELKAASEEAGRSVTRKEWLTSKDLTFVDYRDQLSGQIYQQVYMERLVHGIGGGQLRKTIDLDVTPAEVRKVYRNNPDQFDEPAQVKFAMYRVDYDAYDDPNRSGLEIGKLVDAAGLKVEADARRGLEPAEVARRNRLGEPGPTTWRVTPRAIPRPGGGDPEVMAWLYAPERRPGETRLIPDPSGPVIFHIIEVKPERKRSFEEAYEEIVGFIKAARQMRLQSEEMIRLLQKGSTVWPERLADKLMNRSQDALRELQTLPTLQGVRLR